MSDERDQLIAEQQIQIRGLLKHKVRSEVAAQEIQNMLNCIGGPLNDNKLGYTKEQRVLLHEINNILSLI